MARMDVYLLEPMARLLAFIPYLDRIMDWAPFNKNTRKTKQVSNWTLSVTNNCLPNSVKSQSIWIYMYFLLTLYLSLNKSFNSYHGPGELHFYKTFFLYLIGLTLSKFCLMYGSSVCECGTIRYHIFEAHEISKESRGLASHKTTKVSFMCCLSLWEIIGVNPTSPLCRTHRGGGSVC